MNGSIGKTEIKDFSATYWLVIMFEFFERGAYYGVMSVLTIYMTDILGFSKIDTGIINSTIRPLLYFLPIFAGAFADKLGYRKTLMFAFSFLGLGYFLAAQTTHYATIFGALVVMGIGAGTFKPIISGTIAKITSEKNSSFAFGIYYWSINLGAFIFPLFVVPYLKSINWSYILIMAAILTGAMLIPTIFFFKEPIEKNTDKSISKALREVLKKIWVVVRDVRFITFVVIYSWFWILYFQMFDSVLWYFNDYVNAAPIDSFISNLLGINFKFDIEHITVINAMTIIILQIAVSAIVKNLKALPTIVIGLVLGTIGMGLLAVNNSIWTLLIGLVIFSLGEMTAHPKYISYLGIIAPEDKKATYMGFGFLYGVFGSFIGGLLGPFLYVRLSDRPILEFIKNQLSGKGIALPSGAGIKEAMDEAVKAGIDKSTILAHSHISEFWLIFAGIGIFTILCLYVHNKIFQGKGQ